MDRDEPSSADPTSSDDATPSTKASPAPRTKSERAAAKRSAATDTDTDTKADTDADTDTDSAKTPSAGPKPTGGRQISVTISARSVLRTVAALIVVAALVGVGILGWRYYAERQKLDAFADSKAASSAFAQKLVPLMNADSVGTMKDVLGPLSTGEFRDRLARESDDTQKAVRDLNIKGATPTIKSVSVQSFDTDSASTAVLVEVTGQSSIAPSGGKDLMLVWLELNKQDGKWLVSKLSGAQAGLGPQQGGGAEPAPAPSPPAPAPAPAPVPGG
ncbi:hypothetical protein GCM10009624_33770 [Gordonia sinesedis]